MGIDLRPGKMLHIIGDNPFWWMDYNIICIEELSFIEELPVRDPFGYCRYLNNYKWIMKRSEKEEKEIKKNNN